MTTKPTTFATEASGPLDPDPFVCEPVNVVGPDWEIDEESQFPRFGGRSSATSQYSRLAWDAQAGPNRSIDMTVATVAFIPPNALPVAFDLAFSGDQIREQPQWLSDAYTKGRFRLLHGLRLHQAGFPSGQRFVANPLIAILGKANATKLLHFIPFRAPIEERHLPALDVVPPPGPFRRDQVFTGISSHLRSMNGFLAHPLGRLASAPVAAAYTALGGEPSRAAPQIGSTIQAWLRPDGCKCLAFAHNWFPAYAFYAEGVRVDWESSRDFRKFDGYEIGVEWQPYVAALLYDSLIAYTIWDRYPGAAGAGWYRAVSPDGTWDWCDTREALHIRFPPYPGRDEVVHWWKALEAYLERARTILQGEDERRWHADEPTWSPNAREALSGAWRDSQLHQSRWTVSIRSATESSTG
jgi:hypothetical protein